MFTGHIDVQRLFNLSLCLCFNAMFLIIISLVKIRNKVQYRTLSKTEHLFFLPDTEKSVFYGMAGKHNTAASQSHPSE